MTLLRCCIQCGWNAECPDMQSPEFCPDCGASRLNSVSFLIVSDEDAAMNYMAHSLLPGITLKPRSAPITKEQT